MSNLASSLQIVLIAAAVGWPLAVGLAVVLWSKARAAERQRKTAAIDGDLRGLFREVEAEPVPDRLTLVVEALEEAQALKPTRRAAKKTPQPAA